MTVSDIVCASPRSHAGPERIADFSHLVIVRSGVFLRHTGGPAGRRITASAGTALFFNEAEPYRISHPTSRGDTSTSFAFTPEIVQEVCQQFGRIARKNGGSPYGATHAILSPALLLELYRLRRRLRANPKADLSMEVEERALHFLAGLVASLGDTRNARPDCTGCTKRRQEVAEAVKEALAKNPFVATSLNDLATYLNVSPFHLARTFSAEVGLPIHQYLLRLRLASALERVSDPSANVAAIALDVGFSSPSHFSTAFRKAFGTVPSALRIETLDCWHGASCRRA